MPAVLGYRSAIIINSVPYPFSLDAAGLDWVGKLTAPHPVGNYWPVNFYANAQLPIIRGTILPLVNGNYPCPLSSASSFLSYFMSRTTTYEHNMYYSVPIVFWDGYSGYYFATAQFSSFSLSSSRGTGNSAIIPLHVEFMVYQNGDVAPTPLTVAPALSPFTGIPLTFQASKLRLYRLGSWSNLTNVVSWQFSASNNLTPNMTMISTSLPSTPLLPVKLNAGCFSCTAELVMGAHAPEILPGDTIEISIGQGTTSRVFTLNSFLPETTRSRSVASGRQFRRY